MSFKPLSAKSFFLLFLLLLVESNISIILDLPFLRQIFGFLFLTLLPGILILQILRINKICLTEKFVLSVGLSISFVMFFGLFINNLSLSIGYKTPLSTKYLLTALNVVFIALIIIKYKTFKDPFFILPNLNLTTLDKAFLIAPILFPALSIFGMYIMNATGNNVVLMSVLFFIPVYIIFVCFFNKKLSKEIYPIVIFLISISLLLMVSLRSNHIIGVDTHLEYYYFKTTLNNLHWKVLGGSSLDSSLSISLLPMIYQSITNLNPELLYKILYSSMFSISPLIIYVLSKKYIGEFYAFLASFFFMSQHNFLWTSLLGRTNTAILFFALTILTLLNEDIDPLKKRILSIVFIASSMVSHYATTYIFFFVLLGTYIGAEILSMKYTFKRKVSSKFILLFFALVFVWYSNVTETAFKDGVHFFKIAFDNFNRFFIEEVRSDSTQAMLGKDILEKGIPHKIEFLFVWLTFLLIGIGIIILIKRYKYMSFPELSSKKEDFLLEKFDVWDLVLTLFISGLLVAVVALPYITVGFSLDRAYLFGIVILSIFFVIGGLTLSRYLKIPAYFIILLVVVPYFLSVTGVTYQIFGVPRAITLNSEGEEYDLYYIHDQDSYGAKWLGFYRELDQKIYTDFMGGDVLTSQGNIQLDSVDRGSLFFNNKKIKGYIYLRYYNTIGNKAYVISKESSKIDNISNYRDLFISINKIYDNGESETYR